MSDPSRFPMDERPDYGFTEFDALLTVLDEIPDGTLREEIREALVDRQLDREALVQECDLGRVLSF